MAQVVVIDSGILLASVLKETLTQRAKNILNQWQQAGTVLAAPTLYRYEITAVTRKAVVRGTLTLDEGQHALDYLLTYPIQLYFDDALLKRDYEMAVRFNRPTAYDSQYLAVAERLGVDFWTADERLYNVVHKTLDWVYWLGNFNP